MADNIITRNTWDPMTRISGMRRLASAPSEKEKRQWFAKLAKFTDVFASLAKRAKELVNDMLNANVDAENVVWLP